MKLVSYTLRVGLLGGLLFLLPFCNTKNEKGNDKTENSAKKDDNNGVKKEAQGGGEDTTQVAEKQEGGKTKKRAKAPKVTPDRQYNDIARFISGLEGEEGSAMIAYESNPAWKSYSESTEAQWKSMEAKLPKMRTWAEKELSHINKKGGTLFYPFAGADFLHATTFFPEFDEIVMMGLEPIGTMPNFENINKRSSIPAYFNGMRQSLISILQYSFFQTLHMANDFNKRVAYDIDGTLAVLMFFVTRTGHRILKYEKVALGATGEIISADKAVQGAYYGTKITYRREDKPDEQKNLYYFAVNLGNEPYSLLAGLPKRQDLVKYIESLNITATYLKSASYLMYNGSFNTIRDLILDNSPYLLQDDSGMPLASVVNSKHKWDLIFYGVYAGPIPLFANRWQNDMKVAYQKPEQVRPLPFGIGYQYKEGSSNLMLATKQ
jgi:hypothetical protein